MRFVAFAYVLCCIYWMGTTYRAGFGYFQAMGESLTADDGGDFMHELLGISGVC
jgi:hypothetical protein